MLKSRTYLCFLAIFVFSINVITGQSFWKIKQLDDDTNNKTVKKPNKIIWCTKSRPETQKCLNFAMANERDKIRVDYISSWKLFHCRRENGQDRNETFSRGYDTVKIECLQAANKDECMALLDEEKATMTTLDAGEVFVGGRYHSLVPIAQEILDGGFDYYYTVAVIKKDTLLDVARMKDLRGKRACFASVESFAGWMLPISTLLKDRDIDIIDCNNHVKSATHFFGPSCAVNCLTDKYNPIGDNSDKLCQLCIGKIPGGRCTDADPYAGYTGAFRCLIEAGEIAFLKHTTVPEMLAISEFSSLSSQNFELLCKDGTRRPINDYLACNWGKSPSDAIVVSSAVSFEDRDKYQKFLIEFAKKYPKGGNATQPQFDQFGNRIQPEVDQYGNRIKPEFDQYGNRIESDQFGNRLEYDQYGNKIEYDQNGNRVHRTKRQNFGGPDENRFGNQDNQYGNQDNRYGNQDNRYGNQDNRYGNQDNRYGNDDNRYGNQDNRYGNDDNRYGNQDNRYGNDDNRYGNQDNRYGNQENPYGNQDNADNRPENRQDQDRSSTPNTNSFDYNKYGVSDGLYGSESSFGRFENQTGNLSLYETFSLFDSVPRYGVFGNLLFQDTARGFAPVPENRQTYTAFLGDTLTIIMGIRDCPVNRMTLCVTSDAEKNKCVKMRTALKAQLLKPEMDCYKGHSQIHCMQAIKAGTADVTVLDASDVYTAGLNFDLVPFISEVYNLDDPDYYVVAVAKESDPSTELTYLRTKNTCHGGINTAAGWVYPLAFLISNGWIRPYGCNSIRAAAEYFTKSCVPGALSTEYNTRVPYDNMCDLCHGSSYRYCRRDASEDYYGHTGAFRCLVEGGGHVAFVKHTTVTENTGGKKREWWTRDNLNDDYELLCPDGTRAEINEYVKCNLGKVKANAIVARGGYGYDETQINAFINLFMYAQTFYGRKTADEFSFSMFTSPAPYSDLIFQDATTQLRVIEPSQRYYSTYVGPDFMRARRIVDCQAGTSGNTASIVVLTLSAMFAMFVLGN